MRFYISSSIHLIHLSHHNPCIHLFTVYTSIHHLITIHPSIHPSIYTSPHPSTVGPFCIRLKPNFHGYIKIIAIYPRLCQSMLLYDELFLSTFTPLAVHRYEDMLLEHKGSYNNSYRNNDTTTSVKKKKKMKKEKMPPVVDWYPPRGKN